jgi:hypothetical protein
VAALNLQQPSFDERIGMLTAMLRIVQNDRSMICVTPPSRFVLMGQIGRRLSLGTSDIELPLTKVDDAHDQRVRSARLQTFDYDCVVRALVSLNGIEQFVPGGIATFSVAIGTFVEFEAIPVADALAMMTRRIHSIFSLRVRGKST